MTSPLPQATGLASSLHSKKVVVATESLGPINGVTRATEQLLDYLVAQHIETAVVAPRLQKTETSSERAGLSLVRLDGFPLVYNPELMVVRPFRVTRLFQRTFRPDVIYLASPASLGLQLWWQLRNSGVPLVANFQTDLAYYARLMLPRLLRSTAGWGVDRLTAYFFCHPSIKAVLCPSSASQRYLLGLGVPSEKLRLVGRGVDCQLFKPTKRSDALRQQLAPNGEILLLCVSRISHEKGFEFLAQAYAEVTRQAQVRPDFPKFRLILTGGNANPAIEQAIRGYFEQRNLNVHFTGPLQGEPLAQVFASADIFVYPSLTETFGQVLQEAMASGLPVVARREGGPADLVIPAETGFLADPPDLNAFVSFTLQLIEDAALRVRLGATARAIAETRSWNSINQQIANIMAEFAL